MYVCICWRSCFITAKISSLETVAKREAILDRPKTLTIQGYSELQEPIRTHENYIPQIW